MHLSDFNQFFWTRNRLNDCLLYGILVLRHRDWNGLMIRDVSCLLKNLLFSRQVWIVDQGKFGCPNTQNYLQMKQVRVSYDRCHRLIARISCDLLCKFSTTFSCFISPAASQYAYCIPANSCFHQLPIDQSHQVLSFQHVAVLFL